MPNIKRCRACPARDRQVFDVGADDFQKAAIKHYLNEHPDDEAFRDIVTGSFVERRCDDCGQPFFATVSVSLDGRIAAEAYCPECDEKELVRPILVVDIPVAEYVEREAEPFENDLGSGVDA